MGRTPKSNNTRHLRVIALAGRAYGPINLKFRITQHSHTLFMYVRFQKEMLKLEKWKPSFSALLFPASFSSSLKKIPNFPPSSIHHFNSQISNLKSRISLYLSLILILTSPWTEEPDLSWILHLTNFTSTLNPAFSLESETPELAPDLTDSTHSATSLSTASHHRLLRDPTAFNLPSPSSVTVFLASLAGSSVLASLRGRNSWLPNLYCI